MPSAAAIQDIKQPSVKQRLQRSLAARRGEVVLRRELVRFGSPAQVSHALNQLVAEGKLVRIGTGVYAKAAPGPISGRPMARQPLGTLAHHVRHGQAAHQPPPAGRQTGGGV